MVDNGNAKITSRNLEFDVGIAHGIDELLEPPDLGARCDTFKETKVQVSGPHLLMKHLVLLNNEDIHLCRYASD